MSSIKMVALRKHPFGTGEREAGEEYDATSDESAILIALGWAKKSKADKPVPAPAPAAPAPKSEGVQKVMKAEEQETPAQPAAKRTYQRRDMRAKD